MASDAPTIESADIGPYPEGLFDAKPSVDVTFSDGTEKTLFTFYPDEIDFTEEELVGLTEEEAHKLYHQKDVSYLRS